MANGIQQHQEGMHRVCSELIGRGVFATPDDNHTMVDVYADGDRRGRRWRIEVHTCQRQRRRFVTKITRRGFLTDNEDGTLPLADGPIAPDFWVLFHLPGSFFVLRHKDICPIQKARNEAYADGFFKRNGRWPDFSTGVDNVTTANVERFRGQWQEIISEVRRTL
ncbi:MAG TPA: hypothetical protein VKM93_13835 [Terriglobia bacterium]|nr:hypothetical protein [Terriglobia bacterium]